MLRVGDKLMCTAGNVFYREGKVYTVGDFVNDKYFVLKTGSSEEHWYATISDEGVHVRFNSMSSEYSDACFSKIKNQKCA
jgi:hypothetical protein